jgi:hypothetical protein
MSVFRLRFPIKRCCNLAEFLPYIKSCFLNRRGTGDYMGHGAY